MKAVLNMDKWESPASKYPRKKFGRAAIRSYYYKVGAYECYGLRDYKYYRATKRLRITNLRIGGKTWMVDDPPHWWAMEEHAKLLEGHVVCAGLGLGLMVHALAANPKVTKITVVEINRDVIRLVQPLVPACEIVHGNFWEWRGEPDGVLFDLFVGKGEELKAAGLSVYIDLRQRFASAKTVLVHGMNNRYLAAATAMMSAEVTDLIKNLPAPSPESIKRLKELLTQKTINV